MTNWTLETLVKFGVRKLEMRKINFKPKKSLTFERQEEAFEHSTFEYQGRAFEHQGTCWTSLKLLDVWTRRSNARRSKHQGRAFECQSLLWISFSLWTFERDIRTPRPIFHKLTISIRNLWDFRMCFHLRQMWPLAMNSQPRTLGPSPRGVVLGRRFVLERGYL